MDSCGRRAENSQNEHSGQAEWYQAIRLRTRSNTPAVKGRPSLDCRRYPFCSLGDRFVLPNANWLPTAPTKHLIVEVVASTVPFYFWYPILGVGLRSRPVAGAAVPITTVDKDCHLCAGEEDVHNNAQAGRARAGPKAQAKSVNCGSQLYFGAGIFLPIGLHHRPHICRGCPRQIPLTH
jgi:hypothetical protein